MWRALWPLLWVFTLAGCQQKSPESAPQPSTPAFPYVMLDRFDVGNMVYVRALALTAERLWVGTSVGALEIERSSYTVKNTLTRNNGLANEYVFAIHADADGSVWFGTNGGGITQFTQSDTGVSSHTYFPMHGLADYWVYSLTAHGDDLWIGTWAGLSRFDRKQGTFKTYLKELVNEWVYGLALDRHERLWIGTEGGVNSFDGTNWRAYTHADGLGAPNAKGLPPSKNTGLGTRQRHDLSVLALGQATYNPGYVFCVLADKKDRIWAGTWGGGLALFENGQWRNTTTADGLGGNIVYSLAQDPQGRIWAGTDGGVSVFDENRWQTFNHEQGLPDDNIYSIAADNAEVFIGIRGAVVRFGNPGVQKRSSAL